MKSIRYRRFAILPLVLAASCAGIAVHRTLPAASEEAAIRDVFEKQTAAWNRGDVPAFMEFYWKSPEVEFVGAGGIMRGWDAVLARYRRTYPDAKSMGQLSFSDLEIRMLSSDTAYALGEFHLMREKDHPSGVFTVIVRKFPEGWRVIHDHTTAFPAEEAKKAE
jgi:uncharacterized protein (TIGR02246 family)